MIPYPTCSESAEYTRDVPLVRVTGKILARCGPENQGIYEIHEFGTELTRYTRRITIQ